MGIRISGTTGIDMGNTPVSNVDVGALDYNAVTKQYVDSATNNALPKGFIGMWSGSIASIPTSFALCDGNNGTPDLRDRFIVGGWKHL